MDYLTTSEVAAELGVNDSRVRQLILEGSLPAVKAGRDWLIKPADLKKVAKRPGRGRPKKVKRKRPGRGRPKKVKRT